MISPKAVFSPTFSLEPGIESPLPISQQWDRSVPSPGTRPFSASLRRPKLPSSIPNTQVCISLIFLDARLVVSRPGPLPRSPIRRDSEVCHVFLAYPGGGLSHHDSSYFLFASQLLLLSLPFPRSTPPTFSLPARGFTCQAVEKLLHFNPHFFAPSPPPFGP